MDAELFMKSHMREMVVTKEEQRKMILKLKEESKKKRHLFLEGEFQAERKIGEGSFGLVHKGKYENELVAAKEMVIYKKNYRRIKNETYFLRKLKHPHITKFLGIYVNDYSLNFLFECMEGGDLGQFIFSCRKRAKGGFFKKGERMEDIFPIAQRYSYLVQILWGLQYIHSKNIIHRDIKLENIVLSKDLKVAKLCDFGVARKRKKENEKENEKEEEEGEDETSLLLDSKKKEEKMSVIGTKLYLAPEVRNRSYDTEVDIYAFGIVGIHVLTTNSYYTKALQCYSRRGDLLQFFGECLGEMEKVDKIPLPVCEQIGNSIKTKPEERPTAGVLKEFFVNFIAQSDLKNSEFVKPFLDDWMDGTIKPAEKKNQPINDSVSTSQGSEN